VKRLTTNTRGIQRTARPKASGLAAAVGALLLAAPMLGALPRSADALSFSIPAGRTIVDVDLSSGAGFDYDGTSEELSLVTDVDALRLDDGSSISLPSGAVQFSVLVMLQGAPSVSTVGFDTFVNADFRNGLAFDFTLTDTIASELVFGGDFDGDLQLSLVDRFTFGLNGDLGGGAQLGAFDVTGVNPALAGQVLPRGNLSALLTNIQPSSAAALLDGDQQGFQEFTAQPNIDFNLVPEPGTGALLGLGLGALVAAGRAAGGRRRRS